MSLYFETHPILPFFPFSNPTLMAAPKPWQVTGKCLPFRLCTALKNGGREATFLLSYFQGLC